MNLFAAFKRHVWWIVSLVNSYPFAFLSHFHNSTTLRSSVATAAWLCTFPFHNLKLTSESCGFLSWFGRHSNQNLLKSISLNVEQKDSCGFMWIFEFLARTKLTKWNLLCNLFEKSNFKNSSKWQYLHLC